jgi:DNA-binding NtrC family response regulator
VNWRARVLLVDDSDIVRPLIASILRDGGYIVSEAATCDHAHRILATEEIAAVLCDFSLAGGVNGADCLHGAVRLRPDLKCVLMSGLFTLGNAPELPFPVISKPFDAREILALLARLLDDRDSASRDRGDH